MNDPKVRRWRESGSDREVPFHGYFRRSYKTLKDGTLIEHGGGFMLTTIDPRDAGETKDIVIRSVSVADGLEILVGGDASIMSSGFSIGWSKWRFTYEPENPIRSADVNLAPPGSIEEIGWDE